MTLNRLSRTILPATAVVLMLIAPAGAQQGSSGADWRYISGDAGGTKYSPLAQIDASNVSKLKIA
jgi:glucose dehydrogenase